LAFERPALAFERPALAFERVGFFSFDRLLLSLAFSSPVLDAFELVAGTAGTAGSGLMLVFGGGNALTLANGCDSFSSLLSSLGGKNSNFLAFPLLGN